MTKKEIKDKMKILENDLLKIYQNHKSQEEWDKFWLQHSIKTFKNTLSRINGLANNEMKIFDTTLAIRPFWIDIMKTVDKTLWTTNIASSTESFGNKSLTKLLEIQKNAIVNRQVSIERVFIYDEENELECAQLRGVMNNQIYYKIKVFAIEKSVFKSVSKKRGISSLHDDFMLIDNKFYYKNNFNSDSQSYQNILSKKNDLVSKMIVLKEDIMKEAIAITSNNLLKFPNII